MPNGRGKHEGGHGSRSSGEPYSGDRLLPSPRLCHTRAPGHWIVGICMIEHNVTIKLRCWGQRAYSSNMATRGLPGWSVVGVATVLKMSCSERCCLCTQRSLDFFKLAFKNVILIDIFVIFSFINKLGWTFITFKHHTNYLKQQTFENNQTKCYIFCKINNK